MDLDIDDILADLDRDTTAVASNTTTSSIPLDADTSHTVFHSTITHPTQHKAIPYNSIEDYNELIKVWKNERCAPDLLPYPKLLMGRMLGYVAQQMEQLEIMSMNFFDEDNDHSNGNSGSSSSDKNNGMLPLLCMEAELERIKFVIRSYVRCRLFKIDKFTIYLKQLAEISQEGEGEDEVLDVPSIQELMSDEEIQYHERHFHILLQTLNESVLRHLPEYAQAINETENGTNMVDEPDWKKFVFVRVLKETEPHSNSALKTNAQGKWVYNIRLPEANEDIELSLGGIYVMRYNLIRHLLTTGRVELI